MGCSSLAIHLIVNHQLTRPVLLLEGRLVDLRAVRVHSWQLVRIASFSTRPRQISTRVESALLVDLILGGPACIIFIHGEGRQRWGIYRVIEVDLRYRWRQALIWFGSLLR